MDTPFEALSFSFEIFLGEHKICMCAFLKEYLGVVSVLIWSLSFRTVFLPFVKLETESFGHNLHMYVFSI
jgi:hypothetical protein